MGSFGREVKDFISAFQAGDKIFGSRDDREYKRLRNKYMQSRIDNANDPEILKLKKDRLRASIGLAGARTQRALRGPDPDLTESRRLNNELRRRQLKALDEPATSPAADDIGGYGTAPSTAPAATPGPQSAISPDEEPDAYDTAEADEGEYEGYDDTAFASRGGMLRLPNRYPSGRDAVKRYADGGLVTDDDEDDYSSAADAADDDEDDAADYNTEAVSTSAPAAAPTQQAAAPEAPSKGYSPQAAQDAVQAGLQYARENADNDGTTEQLSAQSRGARAPRLGYYRGNGAASGNEMMAIRNAIKQKFPNMSDAELTMASLAHGYEWKLKQGDSRGAAALAGSMVQYYRQMSDRYKAIAQVAAQHGDVNGSLQAIMKSYANTPDGVDLKLARADNGALSYAFVDTATGKTINKGIASPDQILEFASKASMHKFDDLVSRAKGETGQQVQKGMSMRDTAVANKLIDEGADDQLPQDTATPDKTMYMSAAKNIFMAPQNRQRNLTPEDARGAAIMLADPTTQAGQSAQVDGGRIVKFGNNPPVFIPQAQFEQLAAMRTQRKAAALKAEAEKNKPGILDRAGRALGDAYSAGKAAAATGRPVNSIPGVGVRPPGGEPLTLPRIGLEDEGPDYGLIPMTRR